MQTRRTFLASAAALCAAPGWSTVGNPTHVAAAKHFDGTFWLHGIGDDGADLFAVPLPARGHAAAAHPSRAEAVAFARRPGIFALVLDCSNGSVLAELKAPEGHHFYGHGVFSRDGSRLFTTENAYDRGEGRIGIWDAARGYEREASLPSHGVGPHEIIRLTNSDTLVVANGGIETHPDTGRAKLNLAAMRPNLSYLSADGDLLEQVYLPSDQRLNSIRHIAASPSGEVAIGCQWQGDITDIRPLVWTHKSGESPQPLSLPEQQWRAFETYIGSVAWSGDGTQLIATSPRGGVILAQSHAELTRLSFADDVCGAASAQGGTLLSAGRNLTYLTTGNQEPERLVVSSVENWDNHITRI